MQKILRNARSTKARVVLPELDDPRIKAAADRLITDEIAEPIALMEPDADMVDALVQIRGLKENIAKRMLAKPLIRASAMVATGRADTMVAGVDNPTKRVIEAASLAIGLQDGIRAPSSFFLMLFPDGREMIFADCAVNVAPNADELAGIAIASSVSANALLGECEVALLSFSTGTSGVGSSVDVVKEASELSGFLGPLQVDAALNSTIAEKKGLGKGRANVLIFPDLNAGNIAYKLAQELVGAQAIGPILQGFRKPVCDLSRGATVDDIVAATAVTLALV
jgi:phosphate acetyltransferase